MNHLAPKAIKRVLDIVGASMILIVSAPIMLVISILIKLGSPGPVIFRRQMVGQWGKPFEQLKFRTMVHNAHQVLLDNPELLKQYQTQLKIENDPRITRLGRLLRKTTLDELPQLVNVLRGDLSLVGPRTLGDIELERYGDLRAKVLSMKPGMAGLWVANGRSRVSLERRMELDAYYVDNWSLWLDIKIFFQCVIAVITMDGAG